MANLMRWVVVTTCGAAVVACGGDDPPAAATAGEESGSSTGTPAAGTTAAASSGAAPGSSKGEEHGSSSSGAVPPPASSSTTAKGEAESETGETPVEETNVVRFVALGDGGEGNETQFAVALAVEQVCAERGCEFALYLGDNFYDYGVDSTLDQQFVDKFEMPYADLDFPFYVTLGNHDYGLLGAEWAKSQFQIEYTEYSDKWNMPGEYYAFTVEHLLFVSIDTSRLFYNHDTAEQRAFLRDALVNTEARFSIVYGHHPYVSNGEHGNAGNYEGLPLPIVGGGTIRDFFDEEVCGKVTLYLSGHDHNRQWHPQRCGTEFIVSGAAAKTTGFEHRDGNPTPYFEDDQKAGFAWIEIHEDAMTVAFYDREAVLDHEGTITLGP